MGRLLPAETEPFDFVQPSTSSCDDHDDSIPDSPYIPASSSPPNPSNVRRVLAQISLFSSDDLKLFFALLFSRMTLTAKESVVDLLWGTLLPREQRVFDFPSGYGSAGYGNNRMSEHEILASLRVPWVRLPASSPSSRGNHSANRMPSPSSDGSSPDRTTPGPGPASLEARGIRPPSRGGRRLLLTNGPSATASVPPTTSAPEDTTADLADDMMGAFRRNGRPRSVGGRAGVTPYSRDFEDQLLSLLMEALFRGERGASLEEPNGPSTE